MSFSEQLNSIVKSVDGVIGASLMGFDGIAIETVHSAAGTDAAAAMELNNAWVEYANLLAQLKNAAGALKTGGVAEVSINSEKVMTLMRMVGTEYLLVVGLLPTGNYGKARYAMRISAPLLAKEL